MYKLCFTIYSKLAVYSGQHFWTELPQFMTYIHALLRITYTIEVGAYDVPEFMTWINFSLMTRRNVF